MFCIPIAVTTNGSTRGQELLKEDDWLGLPENRVVFTITGTVWETPAEGGAAEAKGALSQ